MRPLVDLQKPVDTKKDPKSKRYALDLVNHLTNERGNPEGGGNYIIEMPFMESDDDRRSNPLTVQRAMSIRAHMQEHARTHTHTLSVK